VDPDLTVGLYLGKLRDASGLSLRVVAKRIGIHWTRLGEWERGLDTHTHRPVVPPRRALVDLARVYGIAPEPLLALAGYRSDRDPSAMEERLLAAFRRLPEGEQAEVVAALEERARRQ